MSKEITVLIDGEGIAWRTSSSCEPTKTRLIRASQDEAIWRLDNWVYSIINDTAADSYRIFIGGSENFRYSIYPDYKANRRGAPKPEWLEPCREFLVREWGAEICNGYEADDGIGISSNETTIVGAYDKDLDQIPGEHYNFVTKTHYTISDWEAALSFWGSVLQGDRADNVFGLGGVGPKKAFSALSPLSISEMESYVRSCYTGKEQQFLVNYRLLKLLRSEQEYRNVIEEIHNGCFAKSEGAESSKPSSETALSSLS
jgi:5'-3' exonuclease